MQVTEVAAEGLKRQYKVVVPAGEIAGKVDARIKKMAKTVKMPGFRPGKVPVKLLKKQYGKAVMGEVLEQAVNDGRQEAIKSHSLRPALQPKVEVTSFDEGQDLEFQMDVEVLPEMPAVAYDEISLTRPVAAVGDEEVERSLERLAEMRTHYHDVAEPRPAETGDQVTIDFVGKRDGEPFQGGSGEGQKLVLGSGRMIPGFEDAILGKTPNEPFSFEVTFPEEYGEKSLAGQTATFDVTITALGAPHKVALDDEMAKGFGEEDLEGLKRKIRETAEEQYARASRSKLKRALLDLLADRYVFEVPQGMVELEFNAIWQQLEEELKRTEKTFEDHGQSEEEAREEYRGIAERRVRLGLLLSDVGTKNNVRVEPQELQEALIDQARRFPGQERQVIDYFRSNQAALDQLRAPLFEDKVVDFMLERAQVSEERVSVEELMRDPDDEPDEDKDAAAATS